MTVTNRSNLPLYVLIGNISQLNSSSPAVGTVLSTEVTQPGTNYSNFTPSVTFSAPPAGGTTATGRATVNFTTGQVLDIIISNPGSGYVTDPTITIGAPYTGGINATATAAITAKLMEYPTNIYHTSPDGIIWTERKFPIVSKWKKVVSNKQLIAIISETGNFVLLSVSGNEGAWKVEYPFGPSWKYPIVDIEGI